MARAYFGAPDMSGAPGQLLLCHLSSRMPCSASRVVCLWASANRRPCKARLTGSGPQYLQRGSFIRFHLRKEARRSTVSRDDNTV